MKLLEVVRTDQSNSDVVKVGYNQHRDDGGDGENGDEVAGDGQD